MSSAPSPQPKVQQRKGCECTRPSGSRIVKLAAFAGGVRAKVHVRSGFGEDAQEFRKHGHPHSGFCESQRPILITRITEGRVKPKLVHIKYPPTDECGGGKESEIAGSPSVKSLRRESAAFANVLPGGVNNQAIAKDNVHVGMTIEKIPDFDQCAGEILLVAIEIGQQVGTRATITAINGVIHSPVFFDERADPGIFCQPIERAIVRAGILNDVLVGYGLVGNRGNAQREPSPSAKARSDDREAHVYRADYLAARASLN